MSNSPIPVQVTGLRRLLYIALALLFLALGLLGAILPGLPTTPFVLLTSYFLIRSSPRLHDRVMQIPVVGHAIQEWREHRGVRPHVKLTAYAMVFAAVSLTLVSGSLARPLQIAVILLALIGISVVWKLPTFSPAPLAEISDERAS